MKQFNELIYKPLYDQFDSGHNWGHATKVAASARYLGYRYCPELIDIVNIAAYVHDIGLLYGRDLHEIHGSEMVLNDLYLKSILTPDQLLVVSNAVLNHRASTGCPKNMVAKIVADADRTGEFDAKSLLIRTYQYCSKFHNNIEDRCIYAITHAMEKFVTGGPRYKISVLSQCHFPETRMKMEKLTDEIMKLFNMHDIHAIKSFIGV